MIVARALALSMGEEMAPAAWAARVAARNAGNGVQVGITEAAPARLNYCNAWGQRLEVAGSYLAARVTILNDQLAQRQNLTGAASNALPLPDRRATRCARLTSQRANLCLGYRLCSPTSLRLTPSLSWQTTDQLRTIAQQTGRRA